MKSLLESRDISLVLDVGANIGQTGKKLRDEGYRGRIVSFEPGGAAYASLQKASARDPLWTCHNIALGDIDGDATINISANSHSSSLLEASARALEIEPSIAVIGREKIPVRRLADILAKVTDPGDRIFLKIDAQGYEHKIINGALGVIGRFELIQLEVIFFEAYVGDRPAGDTLKFFDYLGYRVVGIEHGWSDPGTGELLAADFIFAK